MKSRSAMSAGEREARSRLAQLAHDGELLRGNLMRMRRVCGKSSCRCARGDRHESWYLCYSREGRKQMVFVPRAMLAPVRDWIARHRKAKGCLETLSAFGLRRLRQAKKEASR